MIMIARLGAARACRSPTLFVAFASLFVLVAAATGAYAEDFVPGRTHLLDYVRFVNGNATANYLFRGNNPKQNNEFAYGTLVATLDSVARNATGSGIPKTFRLIDVSFLVGLDPKESGDLELEKKFFEANPNLGELINWPILTDLLGPCLFSSADREKMVKSGKWDPDDTPKKVGQLHTMLHTQGNIPTIIYIHCEAGVDRTGELSGSYNMMYFNQTYEQVLAFDNAVEPRPISSGAENGLQWFSFYMQYTQGFNPGFSC